MTTWFSKKDSGLRLIVTLACLGLGLNWDAQVRADDSNNKEISFQGTQGSKLSGLIDALQAEQGVVSDLVAEAKNASSLLIETCSILKDFPSTEEMNNNLFAVIKSSVLGKELIFDPKRLFLFLNYASRYECRLGYNSLLSFLDRLEQHSALFDSFSSSLNSEMTYREFADHRSGVNALLADVDLYYKNTLKNMVNKVDAALRNDQNLTSKFEQLMSQWKIVETKDQFDPMHFDNANRVVQNIIEINGKFDQVFEEIRKNIELLYKIELTILQQDEETKGRFVETLREVESQKADLLVITDAIYTPYCRLDNIISEWRFSERTVKECFPTVIADLSAKFPLKKIKVVVFGSASSDWLHSRMDFPRESQWQKMPKLPNVEMLYTKTAKFDYMQQPIMEEVDRLVTELPKETGFLFIVDNEVNGRNNRSLLLEVYGRLSRKNLQKGKLQIVENSKYALSTMPLKLPSFGWDDNWLVKWYKKRAWSK